MSNSLSVGYYGAGFDSPVYKLTEIWGDRLERITADDKFALIALLALWLQNDAEDYGICSTSIDFNISGSPDFDKYIEILDSPPRFHISPNDAMALLSALVAQLRSGVYADAAK